MVSPLRLEPLRRWRRLALPLALLPLAACLRTPEPEDPLRFARLDGSGQTVADAADTHRCVHDRRTTLVWLVPERGHPLLDPEQRYSWYSEDRAAHLGEPGMRDGGRCAQAHCDTAGLVEAANAAGLCGRHDWRLPSREESILLGKRHGGHPVGLHPQLFPNAPEGEFWTATTFRMYPNGAWALDPASGLDRVAEKIESKPARLVSGTLVLANKGTTTP